MNSILLSSTKSFLKSLLYEDGEASRTGLTALLFSITFIIGSMYLLINNINWVHYEIFAMLTTGGGVGGILANKAMITRNSRNTGTDSKQKEE